MVPKTILVVEDNEGFRSALTGWLTAKKFIPVEATDGLSAMRVALETRPDLILLDLDLPGSNGIIVLQRLKAEPELASTPVIILSAAEAQANEQWALMAGAAAFLQKPHDPSKLLTAIQQALLRVPEKTK